MSSTPWPHRYGGEDESWKCIDCGMREYKAEQTGQLVCQGRCPHEHQHDVHVLDQLAPVYRFCATCAQSLPLPDETNSATRVAPQ